MKLSKTIYTLLLCSIIFSLSVAMLTSVQAEQNDITLDLQVDIGNYGGETVGPSTIGNYIKAIYTYAIGAVGILAAFFIVIGGVQWIISAGNPEKINEAKSRIIASLSGLVLVLCSFLLLNLINPDLVTFRPISTKINLPSEKDKDAKENDCSWTAVGTKNSGNTCETWGKIKASNDEICGSISPSKKHSSDNLYLCCCEPPKETPTETTENK